MLLNNKRRTLTFNMTTVDTDLRLERRHNEDTSWPVLLEDFVTFLEGAGYVGVRDHVVIQGDHLFTDGWFGRVISEDDIPDWTFPTEDNKE